MVKEKTKIKEIPVTNDYIFKRIFSKKGNESILKDLLIAILDIQIDRIEVQSEVSLERELEENKLGRLDILAYLNDNTLVNIEVQVVNQYNLIERTMFYTSANYHNELKAGENYKVSKKIIGINILSYNEFEEGAFHEVARMRRDYENKILTEKMEIHFIQLPKYKEEKEKVPKKLGQWIEFILQENKGEVEKAMKENKEIKKAKEEYEYLTGDEAERRLAFLRQKAIMDENTNMQGAREEGIKEGIEKGIKKGKKEGKKEEREEVTKKLLKMKLSIEQIKEATGFTEEEIKKIDEE